MTSKEFSTQLWRLAAHIGKLADSLPDHRTARHAASEMIQAAFAAPQRFDEAFLASSRKEFQAALALARSELQRSLHWLRFLPLSELAAPSVIEDLAAENAHCLQLVTQTLHASGAPAAPDAADFISAPSLQPPTLHPNRPFTGLDHIAIVVPNTDEALKTWQHQLGFPLLFSEIVNNGAIRLTHLDLGNSHLQLVEPLTPNHPLHDWLKKHGPGLHHLCLAVDNVADARHALPKSNIGVAPQSHQGARGRRALFLDPASSQGVPLEITGA